MGAMTDVVVVVNRVKEFNAIPAVGKIDEVFDATEAAVIELLMVSLYAGIDDTDRHVQAGQAVNCQVTMAPEIGDAKVGQARL